ncbi:MAG: hypothetical protein HY537_04270 [Deltaproteobacteria bacterium]|nr:hypothetical protein [Deltaproteobacteria bacterium]
MKSLRQWKEDPIVEEVQRIRAKLVKEYKKDPKAFNARIIKRALDAGFKISTLKPISLEKLREKKQAKKNGPK